MLHMWAASGFLSPLQYVSDLFAKVCAGGGDPRHDEIKLVDLKREGSFIEKGT